MSDPLSKARGRVQLPAGELARRLAGVRLFLCDVDGVLTDGTVFIGGTDEIKQFNILDGLGMKILQRQGIRVGWISNRPSAATLRRSQELKMDFLHQQDGNKVLAAEAIIAEAGLSMEQVLYVGDDVVDLALFERVGVAVAVANAIEEAHAAAHYITRQRGGDGAVREVAELLLEAQGKWARVLEQYRNP